MGTWSSGNFDNDAAQDILSIARDVFWPQIDGFLRSDRATVEDIDETLACIAIHLALIKGVGVKPPDREFSTALRQKIVRIYDEQIDGLKPKPE